MYKEAHIVARMLHILTSVWVLRIPNACKICLVNVFHAEKLKREKRKKFAAGDWQPCICFIHSLTQPKVENKKKKKNLLLDFDLK